MNKQLFQSVKQKCKDTGLSEKYLTAITEKIGGSVEDDSTDEKLIDATANQVVDIATASQGEATRWVNAHKEKDSTTVSTTTQNANSTQSKPVNKTPVEANPDENPVFVAMRKKMETMENEMNEMKVNKGKEMREGAIKAAATKHAIPEWRLKGLSVPEDADPDAFMADIKQDLITNNLIDQSPEGGKTRTEEGTNEAATSLLEEIIAK